MGEDKDGNILSGEGRNVSVFDALIDVIGNLHDADVLVETEIPCAR